MTIYKRLFAASVLVFSIAAFCGAETVENASAKSPPKIGDTISDVSFHTFDGKELKLAEVTAKGPVVLVVLRGYPGYQCPACTAQVADLRKHAKDFAELGANVVLVYPGEAQNLAQHATGFLKDAKLPAPLVLVTDPDYKFIEEHNLRWDKPGETSYPSTFVVGSDSKVYYAKISKTHGDRAKTDMLLDVLRAKRASHAEGKEIPQDAGKRAVPRR